MSNNTDTWHCAICYHDKKAVFIFREMMFGFREAFEYAECLNCGCLQILKEPANVQQYYPPYYYSFNREVPALKRIPLLKRLFGDIRMQRVYNTTKRPELQMLAPANVSVHAKILDIGCGNGELICTLFNKGFENVQGVDKFIAHDLDYGYGVKVLKAYLATIPTASYNFLMMNHVLEHIPNQLEEIKECYRILKSKSFLMVRIPVKNKAWQLYKENWVQLDPPRHFFIHTVKSMQILAANAGFNIKNIVFDSTAFQFLGSEQYKKDIPLHLPDSHKPYPITNLFSETQIADLEKEAIALNAKNEGDQAAFYLYKS